MSKKGKGKGKGKDFPQVRVPDGTVITLETGTTLGDLRQHVLHCAGHLTFENRVIANDFFLLEDGKVYTFVALVPTITTLPIVTPIATPAPTQVVDNRVLPALGKHMGSSALSSIPNEDDHLQAEICAGVFSTVAGIVAKPMKLMHHLKRTTKLNWGSESDIQGFVKTVLAENIEHLGLGDKLSCLNELSVFQLRPDIWTVCTDLGVPIGVVEVKRPTGIDPSQPDPLASNITAGQMFDYLMRLKSFHGIHFAFGIVTTYNKWRIYWLSDANACAAATIICVPQVTENREAITEASDTADDAENEPATITEQTNSNFRKLCASEVYAYHDPQLSCIIQSVLLKMYNSPYDMVAEISNDRLYIVLSPETWTWAKVQWKAKTLNRQKLPTPSATQFILLRDLRGGADGRVWMACTPSGLTCVLKFARFGEWAQCSPSAITVAKKRLEHEQEMYTFSGITTRLVTLGQRPALLIPHFSPVDFHDPDSRELVTTAVRALAVEKRIFHGDMKNEHVLWVSPTKGKPGRVVTIDMAQARQINEGEDVEVLADRMVQKLNFG